MGPTRINLIDGQTPRIDTFTLRLLIPQLYQPVSQQPIWQKMARQAQMLLMTLTKPLYNFSGRIRAFMDVIVNLYLPCYFL